MVKRAALGGYLSFAKAFAVIAEGCREAGVGHDQASDIIQQWKLSKVSQVTQDSRD